jgi:hypothetical protein
MGILTKILAGAATLALGMSTLAAAEESGLAGLHAQKSEGKRICMSEHFHHGSSAGKPTQKEAEAAAIRDWSGFTGFEYGEAWSDYAIAASKTMKCARSGDDWSCELDARPCKSAKERRQRATPVKTD